jgi:nicotinamidase-related amidase
MFNQNTSALILVDYQVRLLPSIYEGEKVLAAGVFLAHIAQILNIPVLGTEQNPAGLGPNDERIKNVCHQTVEKHAFNGATDGLGKAIKAINPLINQVVLAGCESHVCLMQTTLGLQALDFEVAVVPEACGSRTPQDKSMALERLSRHQVELLSPEMLAYEWLKSSDHPQFKDILQLIKRRDVQIGNHQS